MISACPKSCHFAMLIASRDPTLCKHDNINDRLIVSNDKSGPRKVVPGPIYD